jgi:hypothetical protein
MHSKQPIKVEVFAYAPTAFFHCKHCEIVWQETGASKNLHEEQVESSLPEDLKQQYQLLSDWVRDIIEEYEGRVSLKVVDAVSLEGWFKSLWYGIRRFPAVVIDGNEKIIGGRFEQATAVIRQKLSAYASAS